MTPISPAPTSAMPKLNRGGRGGKNNPRRPTDLLGAKLVRANLSRANLSRALLVRVDLTGADLQRRDPAGRRAAPGEPVRCEPGGRRPQRRRPERCHLRRRDSVPGRFRAAMIPTLGLWTRTSGCLVRRGGRNACTSIIPKKNKCRSLTVTCFHTNSYRFKLRHNIATCKGTVQDQETSRRNSEGAVLPRVTTASWFQGEPS